MSMNFVFYDLETTGRNSTWDQIIQVAAILVDKNFNELERFEDRCRLRSGLVPEPGALLVNKTSIEMLNNVNLSHYGLIKKLQDKFKKWSPAIFIGYNTISFDEEFLRKSFFGGSDRSTSFFIAANSFLSIIFLSSSKSLY